MVVVGVVVGVVVVVVEWRCTKEDGNYHSRFGVGRNTVIPKTTLQTTRQPGPGPRVQASGHLIGCPLSSEGGHAEHHALAGKYTGIRPAFSRLQLFLKGLQLERKKRTAAG